MLAFRVHSIYKYIFNMLVTQNNTPYTLKWTIVCSKVLKMRKRPFKRIREGKQNKEEAFNLAKQLHLIIYKNTFIRLGDNGYFK